MTCVQLYAFIYYVVRPNHSKIKKVVGIVLLINMLLFGAVLKKNASVYVDVIPNSNAEINNIRLHNLDQHQMSKPTEMDIYTERDKLTKSPSNRSITVKINHNSTHYICTDLRAGRLGNKLYIFSSAYGIARSKGMKLSITEGTQELESTFHLKGAFYKNKSVCNHVKTIHGSGCCKLSQSIMDMPNNKSFRVSNYLQSYKYFEKYRDEVRRFLTFRDEILKEATFKLENMLSEKYGGKIKRNSFNRTLVGVHIRRGDYLLKDKKKFGYKVATKEYIHSAMDYMRRKYSNVTFIVCSIDLKWANDVLSGMIDVIIAPVGAAILDLALLSIMDHTIITVGTYGFWSAWLNQSNGTVIYYKDFKVPNSNYAREFADADTDTYFPYWIGM